MQAQKTVWALCLTLLTLPASLLAQENRALPDMSVRQGAAPLDPAYLAEIDSIMLRYEEKRREQEALLAIDRLEKARLTREMSFRWDGALPLFRGLCLTATQRDFIRQPALFPRHTSGSDYADYAVAASPLLAAWALKAAGVESRSKPRRMLTANAMALALSAAVTQVLKKTVNETRPDGSDRSSLSSGHTSLAFVSASILAREYGHHSPWIAVGGYAAASSTQLLRIGHNKHWINDLYLGAGIGIVSTNLAYFLTDRIFGQDGVRRPQVRRRDILRQLRFMQSPSGLSVVAGIERGSSTIHTPNLTFDVGAAMSAGADLSWHTSSVLSLELMTRAVDAQVKPSASMAGGPTCGADTQGGAPAPPPGGHLRLYHLDLGAKASLLLTPDRRVGLRAFAGARVIDGFRLTEGETPVSIPSETKPEIGLGLVFEALDADTWAWGVNVDYHHTFSDHLKDRYTISSVWKVLF